MSYYIISVAVPDIKNHGCGRVGRKIKREGKGITKKENFFVSSANEYHKYNS